MHATKNLISHLTFWRVLLIGVLAVGLYSTFVRFFYGLGASTSLNDAFPWGIWIGFDVMSGVALAAGGFTISAVVYIFGIERFRPIVKPTILTAFLGYGLVVIGLFFDLGRGDRIWHPLIMWNPKSVMFEIGWCVTLYSTVLALEFSPMVFEALGWKKPLKAVKSIMIPLVLVGVILSCLHQSSLGSLFLIVPGKLHPLWYSPLLPVFFFVSAVALGCAMTIFESFLSWRAFGKRLELSLLTDLGRVIVVVLSIYLVLRVQDLITRGAIHFAWGSGYESRLFQAEIILGVIAPILLLAFRSVRMDDFGLFTAAVMVISGFVMNRINVSITGMEASAGTRYVPAWTEVAVTLSLVGMGFLLFALAVRYLNVFSVEAEEPAETMPAVEHLRWPLVGVRRTVMAATACLFLIAVLLAADGVVKRPELPSTATDAVGVSTQVPIPSEVPTS